MSQSDSAIFNHPQAIQTENLPKIGIRPAFYRRRRGVRESLEDQTMSITRRTVKFLSANLRHPDGQPVQRVVADTCIGVSQKQHWQPRNST
jgi:hypothetical protein